ncbi:MAG TPA: cytochrome C biogenesis protein [Legionellales bacterium]|nr:cytochrome C biogenesis protein [Legionellales bacterium]HCA89025.1 cytochrome C biogenesis protein [Legionellales bacterium]|tara:strand:+ start:1042 stop:1938 length:897 start_codon:yes stop_codon:yes gene_type:complete
MAFKDYYQVMGLDKQASSADIKRTYRKLARKFHPDVSKEPDAEAKFKELGEAYAVLGDSAKRAQYDQYGEHWQAASANESPNTHQAYQSTKAHTQSSAQFEDFLNDIFREHYHASPNLDIHAHLSITLEESFEGVTKTIELNTQHPHDEIRRLNIKIPQGSKDKAVIRLKGQGASNAQGQKGDLYIQLNLQPHPLFTVKGQNIYLTLPVSPWEAALGLSVPVPTLGGIVQLKLPKNAQPQQVLRLKGKGLSHSDQSHQMVRLTIVMPTSLDNVSTQLYEQLAKHYANFNPRAALGVQK